MLVNANSMSVSLVLFMAKVCLGLLTAQVWKHKLARSESCEYLPLRVRSYAHLPYVFALSHKFTISLSHEINW